MALLLGAGSASATSTLSAFNNLVVFGGSLVDAGNTQALLTGGMPGLPT